MMKMEQTIPEIPMRLVRIQFENIQKNQWTFQSPEEWEAVENQSQWEADPTIDDRQRERTVSGSYAGAVSLDNSTDFPTIGDQSNAKKISAALTQPPQIPRARTVSGGHKTEIPVSYVEGAVCRNFFRYI